MRNWKSTFAFFIFVGVYVFTVAKASPAAVIDATGFVALVSSILMMFRGDFTSSMLEKLVDNVKISK